MKPFELDELTITQLQDGQRSGKYTAQSLVEKYLARIQEVDRSGPTLRAVIETNPEALAILRRRSIRSVKPVRRAVLCTGFRF